MKKLAVLVLALLTVATLSMSVFATQSAFEPIEFTSETPDELVELWDDPDTLDQGGSGHEITKMDDYGVGYSSLNDQVIFHNVDFGENGANKFHIWFSMGNDEVTTLDIHLDTVDSEPIAQINDITNTGGWSKDCAEEFTAYVEVLGGVHDVIVEFTNSNSGSFAKIAFDEAPARPVVVEEEPEVVEEAPVEEEPVILIAPAPKTADAGIVVAVAVMALCAGVVLTKKH